MGFAQSPKHLSNYNNAEGFKNKFIVLELKMFKKIGNFEFENTLESP